jgi:hypothetical protein
VRRQMNIGVNINQILPSIDTALKSILTANSFP